MEKPIICPLNFNKEIPEIQSWVKNFANHPNFAGIKHFILEDNTYYGLDEVIATNYEFFNIGTDEKNYCLAIKIDNQVIGFVLACAFNLTTPSPELIIQYIVIRPDYQHQGIGKQVVTELINNAFKYFNSNPTKVYANIQQDNLASTKLFSNLGFTLKPLKNDYLQAQKTTLALERD